MDVIIKYIGSLLEAGITGVQYIIWLVGGLVNLGAVMSESTILFREVLEFFPYSVSSTLIAMCGGLIVFRIFGRS